MSAPRLASELYIQAHLRRCAAEGIAATVLHRGDAWGGALVIRINLLGPGFRLFTQTRDAEGEIAWLALGGEAPLSEAASDIEIARQIARDPDLWVVEIDSREGRNPFAGKIL